MRLGVTFPQLASGTDPIALRDFVQAVEGIGFDHLLIYDHVLGADSGSRPGWKGIYTHQSLFHEPLVFLGYVASVTTRIELVTGVVVLPQRQTALVAKQAAEVDVLSGGQLRLGGWDDRVLRRVGRLADGWFPLRHPVEGWAATIERVHGYTREFGRDPSAIGIEPRFTLRGTPDDWRRAADEWRSLGATHLSVHTMDAGFSNLDEHVAAIRAWWETVR